MLLGPLVSPWLGKVFCIIILSHRRVLIFSLNYSIHERSAREKIFSSQVAHVLNDEASRKWIQSVKRLMTFAQTKYPPYTLSQIS
jgi:hypothetical protein